jgi:hypothetical protein
VKTTVLVVVALLAFAGYRAYERSGKMSAKQLETILNNKLQNPPDQTPTPGHIRLHCSKDTSGKWDYVCAEPTTGTVFAFDVNRSRITRGSGPSHPNIANPSYYSS